VVKNERRDKGEVAMNLFLHTGAIKHGNNIHEHTDSL